MITVTEPEFDIIRSRRRTRISFTIDPESGRLQVLAPWGIRGDRIEELVARNSAVVEYLRRRWSELERRRPRFEFREGGSFLYLGNFHRLHLSRRTTGFDGREFLIPHGSEEEVRERLERLYRRLAAEHLTGRVAEFAGKFQLSPGKIRIGGALRRWGSCSRRGDLNYSWRLIQCPERLIDYVVIHELAHLIELNHSSRFWEQVGRMCPRYRECRLELTDDAILYGGF